MAGIISGSSGAQISGAGPHSDPLGGNRGGGRGGGFVGSSAARALGFGSRGNTRAGGGIRSSAGRSSMGQLAPSAGGSGRGRRLRYLRDFDEESLSQLSMEQILWLQSGGAI